MKPRDISHARNPDLRASQPALRRAAALARKTAIDSGTDLIVVRDGQTVRISADTLRSQTKTDRDSAR